MSCSMSQISNPDPEARGPDVDTVNIDNIDRMTICADQVIVSRSNQKRSTFRRRCQSPEEYESEGLCENDDEDEDEDCCVDEKQVEIYNNWERRRRYMVKSKLLPPRSIFVFLDCKTVRDAAVNTTRLSDEDDDSDGDSGDDIIQGCTGDYLRGTASQGTCRAPPSTVSRCPPSRRVGSRANKEVQVIMPPSRKCHAGLRVSSISKAQQTCYSQNRVLRQALCPTQRHNGGTQTSNYDLQPCGGPPIRPRLCDPPLLTSMQTQSRVQRESRCCPCAPTQFPSRPQLNLRDYATVLTQTSNLSIRAQPPSSHQLFETYTQTNSQQQFNCGYSPPSFPSNLQMCCTGRPCDNPEICPGIGTNTDPPPPPPCAAYFQNLNQRAGHHALACFPQLQPPQQTNSTQTHNYGLNQVCCTGRPYTNPSICPGASVRPPYLQTQAEVQPSQWNQLPHPCRPQPRPTKHANWTQTPNFATSMTQTSRCSLPPVASFVSPPRPYPIGAYRPGVSFNLQSSFPRDTRCCWCDPTSSLRRAAAPVTWNCCTDVSRTEPSVAESTSPNPCYQTAEEPRVQVQVCPGLPASHSFLVVPLGQSRARDADALYAAAREAVPASLRVAERPEAVLVECGRGAAPRAPGAAPRTCGPGIDAGGLGESAPSRAAQESTSLP